MKLFSSVFGGGMALVLAASAAFASTPVTGTYVEARNANVFVGACHFGSEYEALGRDAILAWHVNAGDRNGTSLAGLNVVAVIAGQNNLAEAGTPRTSLIFTDARATKAQAEALASMVKGLASASLGRVLAVRPAPVTFHSKGDDFNVAVPGTAAIDASRLADRSCCVMPYQVWYRPLAPVEHAIVGTARENNYSGGDLHASWSFPGQNSAFIGDFSTTL